MDFYSEITTLHAGFGDYDFGDDIVDIAPEVSDNDDIVDMAPEVSDNAAVNIVVFRFTNKRFDFLIYFLCKKLVIKKYIHKGTINVSQNQKLVR